jgi:hypothetical protein
LFYADSSATDVQVTATQIKDFALTGGTFDGTVTASTVRNSEVTSCNITASTFAGQITSSTINNTAISSANITASTYAGNIHTSTLTGVLTNSSTIQGGNTRATSHLDAVITTANITASTYAGNIAASTLTGVLTNTSTIQGGNARATTLLDCPVSSASVTTSNLQTCTITNSTFTGNLGSGSTIAAGVFTGQHTFTNSTINAASIIGSTLTGNLGPGTTATAIQLKGTSTLPIVQMTSSGLLATPVSGGVEFDGVGTYVTGASAARHLVKTAQIATITTSYAISTDSTGSQKFLNASTNGAVNVGPNQSYLFEAGFEITALSTVSGSVGWNFGGTATITHQAWHCMTLRAAATSVPTACLISYHRAASTGCIAAASTIGQVTAYIKGKLVITTSGTLIPNIHYGTSGVTGAPTVSQGAYFVLTPIGSELVNTVGNWT